MKNDINRYPPYVNVLENWDGRPVYIVYCPRCKEVVYQGYDYYVPNHVHERCGCHMGVERMYLEFISNFNGDKTNNRRRISNRTQGVSNG